jgi:hypothetical protein
MRTAAVAEGFGSAEAKEGRFATFQKSNSKTGNSSPIGAIDPQS